MSGNTKARGEFSIGQDVWPGTSKLVEEMGELQQVLGKLIGNRGEEIHFDGTNLRARLIKEIADVAAALRFFQEANLTASERSFVGERYLRKLALFEAWQRDDT